MPTVALTEKMEGEACGGQAQLEWGGHCLVFSMEPRRDGTVRVEGATTEKAGLLGRFLTRVWNDGPVDFLDRFTKREGYRCEEFQLTPQENRLWTLFDGQRATLTSHSLLSQLVSLFGQSALTWTRFCPSGQTSEVDAIEHRLMRLRHGQMKKPGEPGPQAQPAGRQS